MNATLQRSARAARVGFARAQQLVGWAGIAGAALLLAALCVLGLAGSAQRSFLQANAARAASAVSPSIAPAASEAASASARAEAAVPRVPMDLPRIADVPLLLTQMEQAAVSNGLAWRAADYKTLAASTTQPASLEVRCSIKGTYPKFRSMLVQLIDTVPAFAIREFNVSRPNADSLEVEAKLVLAVILQDEASGPEAAATKATP